MQEHPSCENKCVLCTQIGVEENAHKTATRKCQNAQNNRTCGAMPPRISLTSARTPARKTPPRASPSANYVAAAVQRALAQAALGWGYIVSGHVCSMFWQFRAFRKSNIIATVREESNNIQHQHLESCDSLAETAPATVMVIQAPRGPC